MKKESTHKDYTFEVKKEKKTATNKERGEGGPYKELKIPALSPKSPRSGITVHFVIPDHELLKDGVCLEGDDAVHVPLVV